MEDALIINPHDPSDTAGAMAQAMRMTLEERRERHSRLLKGVVEQDIAWWSRAYLTTLDQAS